jgi:hypothetical protein
MQTTLETILSKKYLIAALTSIVAINLASNLLGQEMVTIVGNLMYVPVGGSLLVLAAMIFVRFGMSGHHGVAWFSFLGYAISFFTADMLWLIQELYLKIETFPSISDIFYIIAYPFLLMFFVSYFQPVRKAITKKMFAAAIAISVGILIPSLHFAFSTDSSNNAFDVALAASYPTFDAMVLIPALIGVALFFKGQVNLMWTLFCFGAISVLIADTAFLLAQNEDSYYLGNPMEIPFYWNYILLAFGVHNHLVLFKTPSKQDKLEDLR